MPNAKPWLKLWLDTLPDRKLRRIDPALRWCWIGLLLMAAECDDHGRISEEGAPLEDADFADSLAVPEETWSTALTYFLSKGMLTLDGDGCHIVTKFDDRQAAPDTGPAARMQRLRAKQAASQNGNSPAATSQEGKSVTCDAPVTPTVTPPLRSRYARVTPAVTPPLRSRYARVTPAVTPPLRTEAEAETEAEQEAETEGETSSPTSSSAPTRRGHPDDDAAALPPEHALALQILRESIPDFFGAPGFVRRNDPRLVAEWSWYIANLRDDEKARQRIANPAGLLRSQVKRGIRPDPRAIQQRYADPDDLNRWDRLIAQLHPQEET